MKGNARADRLIVLGVSAGLILAIAMTKWPATHGPTALTCGLLLYVTVLRRLNLDRWNIGILLGAVLLQCVYLSYTSYTERTADAALHLDYVRELLLKRQLLAVGDCHMCHHPPLYYAVGALLLRVADWAHVKGTIALQYLSLVFSAASMATAAMILRQFLSYAPVQRTGVALVAFWPSTILASCRLHNDSLVNLLVLLATYGLLRWHRSGKPKHLRLASVAVGLGLLSKSTSLAILLFWVVLVSFRWCRARSRLTFLRRNAPASLPLLVLVGVAMGLKWLRWPRGSASLCSEFAGRICRYPWRALPNDWTSYGYLHLGEYLRNPYLIVNVDQIEEGYFWNCLLKSSLFGMHQWELDRDLEGYGNRLVVTVLNCLLLLVLGYVALSFMRAGWHVLRRLLPLLVLTAISLVTLIGFRAWLPNPFHSDFRHIQPVLVYSVAIFMSLVELHHRKWRSVYYLGLAFSAVIVLGSVYYFLPKP